MNDPKNIQEIDNLLAEMYKAKKVKAETEKKYDICKENVKKIMKKLDTKGLVSQKYKLSATITESIRETVSKSSLPLDVWTQYKKPTPVYTLNLKKL
jgi:repressor of nif and glnA expression